jgi:hypothetical protein
MAYGWISFLAAAPSMLAPETAFSAPTTQATPKAGESTRKAEQLTKTYLALPRRAKDAFAGTLAKKRNAKEIVAALLSSSDVDSNVLGAKTAEALGPAAAPLAQLLADVIVGDADNHDSDVGDAAAKAMIAIGEPSAMPAAALVRNIGGPGRYYGFEVLSGLGPKAAPAIPALIELLTRTPKEDFWSRRYVETLANIGPSAEPALCEAIERGAAPAAPAAAQTAAGNAMAAIEKMARPTSPPLECLMPAIRSIHPPLRRGGLTALSRMPSAAGLKIVEERFFGDPDDEVRDEAARSLAHLGGDALPILDRGLSSADRRTRLRAMAALEAARAEESAMVPLLTKLKRSPDEELKMRGAIRLAKIQRLDQVAARNLAFAFTGGSIEDRRSALGALSAADPASPPYIEVLGMGLRDPSFDVRRKALEVLVSRTLPAGNVGPALLGDFSGAPPELGELIAAAWSSYARANSGALDAKLSGASEWEAIIAIDAIRRAETQEQYLPALLSLSQAEDHDVAQLARTALMEAGPTAAAALLERIETSASPRLLAMAAEVDASGIAVEAIEKIALDPNQQLETRIEATLALARMSGNADRALIGFARAWSASSAKILIASRLAEDGPVPGTAYAGWALATIAESGENGDLAIALADSADLAAVGPGQVLEATRRSPGTRLAYALLRRLPKAVLASLSRDDVLPFVSSPEEDIRILGWMLLEARGEPDAKLKAKTVTLRASELGRRSPREELAKLAASPSLAKEQAGALIADGLTNPEAVVRAAAADQACHCPYSLSLELAEFDFLRRFGSETAPTWGRSQDGIERRLREIMATDQDAQVRRAATLAFARVARSDRVARDYLTARLDDADEEVAVAAVLGLSNRRGGDKALVKRRSWRTETLAKYIASIAQKMHAGMTAYAIAPSRGDFQKGFPRLPWPPGHFVDRLTFSPAQIGRHRSSPGSFYDRLRVAAAKGGYSDPSLYAIPGGFAATLAPERVSNGPAASASSRWIYGKIPATLSNPIDYVSKLLLGSRDRYRWFVFYATTTDFQNSGKELSFDEVRKWASSGHRVLPSQFYTVQSTAYSFGVLIYEFSGQDGTDRIVARATFSAPAQQQLIAAGLYRPLFTPNPQRKAPLR